MWIVIPVITVAFFSAVGSATEDTCCEIDTNRQPLWATLIELGRHVPKKQCEWSTDYHSQIAFTEPRKVVVGFHFDCIAVGSSIPPIRTHTLDAIVQIDAQDGKVLNTLAWDDISTEEQYAEEMRVLPTGEGKFLVSMGPFLKLISSDFKELKSRKLPPVVRDGSHNDYWAVHVSSDGSAGLLQHRFGNRLCEDHWFSTETLEDVFVEKAPLDELWRSTVVADNNVYYGSTLPRSERKGPEPPVYVRKRGQKEGNQLCAECYGIPLAVLANGVLIVATGPKASFALVTGDGELHRVSYGRDIDSIGSVAPAWNVARFAFGFGHLQKRLWFWRDQVKVVVFDVTKMKDILELKIKQRPREFSGGQTWPPLVLALSPDGNKLLVLSGSILKLFEIH